MVGRNIPDEVWQYRLGGFNPFTKWLAYRVNTALTPDDRHAVMHLVRRLYGLFGSSYVKGASSLAWTSLIMRR